MDDLIVFSKALEEHRHHLGKVISRLQEFNLRVAIDKTHLCQTEVRFMGHILSEAGVRPNPRKIEAIRKMPASRDVKELRSFLGMANYYRRFIKNFSEPLTSLTMKRATVKIVGKAQENFEGLKRAMSETLVLRFPQLNQPFILTTDASQVAA
jgi:hypothetical protein